MIEGLQTIISRQTELTKDPAVITIGKMNSGIRENIIPEYAEMSGTIRTFDEGMRADIHDRIVRTAEHIAASARAWAEVTFENVDLVTYNDPTLTEKMLPSLERAAGPENVHLINPDTGAEDFSYYQKEIPGLYFFIGGCPPDVDPAKAPSHHTPDFFIDENGMRTGLKAMVQVTLDYMYSR